jgi:endonuclease/exonuclease/phosphatase family metal-dependent hydrolase
MDRVPNTLKEDLMSQRAARRHARRRRHLSLGFAALLGLNIVAVLATAQGSVPAFTPAADELPGSLLTAHGKLASENGRPVGSGQISGSLESVSRGLDRDGLTTTPVYKTQKGHTFKLKPEVLQARQRAQNPTVFRVATLNVLGAAHTAKGGNKQGWASGTTRMHRAVELLRGASIDVVGFQEFEPPQYSVFRNSMPGWGVYPGPKLRRGSMADSIAWDEGQWELVDAETIDIPYFYGKLVAMPYVLLRNRASGQAIWFANFHNPADTRGPAQHLRDRALSLQIDLANRLTADGTPVIITGDMNEREDYFCRMTAGAPMHSASGGSTGAGCAPPAHVGIDWIFGSTDLDFANYVKDDGRFVNKTTDHPFVWAEATLD